MNSRRRTLVSLLGLAPVVFLPLAAHAQARDYIELKPPLPVDVSGKVEVLELFTYGCIHCYNLEPILENWLKKKPADVEFRRVPAVFNRQMQHDALIFYAFEALGVLGKLHKPFFDAIHRDRLRTTDRPALEEWLQKNGVDAKKFDDAMKSFGVQSKTKRAQQLTLDYKIDGTPSMAVHGRYTISAGDGMFNTVDFLIADSRKLLKK
jgi:thiol:disulfide interchange protein DsbA